MREQHKVLVAEMVRQLEQPTPQERRAQEYAAAALASPLPKSSALPKGSVPGSSV